jgi:hypothetical protein
MTEKTVRIPLNNDANDLLNKLYFETRRGFQYSDYNDLYYDVTFTEQNLSKCMYYMDGKPKYKELKDWFQKHGNDAFGWKD